MEHERNNDKKSLLGLSLSSRSALSLLVEGSTYTLGLVFGCTPQGIQHQRPQRRENEPRLIVFDLSPSNLSLTKSSVQTSVLLTCVCVCIEGRGRKKRTQCPHSSEGNRKLAQARTHVLTPIYDPKLTTTTTTSIIIIIIITTQVPKEQKKNRPVCI